MLGRRLAGERGFEQVYPYNLSLNYGRSDYNVGKAFKLYGMWQPIFFHGSRSWMGKVVGGWTLSGILNLHSGFPWSPVVSVVGGSLYCGNCGYGQLQPAAYLGGAGTSTSNHHGAHSLRKLTALAESP